MKKRFLSMFALLLVAATGAWAQTTVNGRFTVNADGDQVQFASGNLRYTSGAWSFFDHQYDYYAEYSANSWDKFGWSTSGTTYGKSTSTNESLYKGNFVDWGNAVGTGWRTLSNDEWAYVVNTRSAATVGGTDNGRYAKAKVNDVNGLILFPDTYTHPDGVTAPTNVNTTGASFDSNTYTAADWTKMESAGCVFLPAAGGRYNYQNPTLVVNVGNEGGYWSSTSGNSTATLLSFNQVTLDPSITDSPRMGYSVRLVKSVTTYAVSLKAETADGANWTISPAKAAEGATVTATYKGEKKVKSVKAVKKAAAILLDNTITAWTAGTYAVPAGGLTYSDAITVSGNVTLVLTDGETLTLNKGISLASGATLTVEGNGTMNVNGTNENTTSTVAGSTGTLILTSGTLTATGGNGLGVDEDEMTTDNRAYAGGNAINGNVTVSGGTLTAIGGNGGSIGDYSESAYGADGGVAISGSVTVTDGTVTATGGNGGSIGFGAPGAKGGSGGAAIGGDATVNGGTWTASNGTNGGGDGGKAVAGTVTDNR